MALPESPALRLAFNDHDSAQGVSRATLEEMAALMQITETEVIHHALAQLARSVLPRYERDDRPLSEEQLAAIRDASGVEGFTPTRSIFRS